MLLKVVFLKRKHTSKLSLYIKIPDDLRKDPSITIKEADKRGGISVLNKCDYEDKVYRQLLDITFYESIASDPTAHVANLI